MPVVRVIVSETECRLRSSGSIEQRICQLQGRRQLELGLVRHLHPPAGCLQVT